MAKYDIIICGAGGAGLSFAYSLSKSIWAEKKILLLDKDSKEKNDRTWCFWSKEKPEYSCAKSAWNEVTFEGENFTKTASISPYTYYQINGLDFYEEIKTHLYNFPNIEFQQESVKNITDFGDFVEVQTDENIYQATWIFNSIPQLNTSFKLPQNTVKQYFKGFFVRTNEPVFSPERIKLMDFSQSSAENEKIQFFYVLPYSENTALIECTVFSSQKEHPDDYNEEIANYIQQKFGITDFQIMAEETGAIPMTDKKISFKTSKRVFHIGTAGGMTKATTGYTFQNIQRFCKNFIENWKAFDMPPQEYVQAHSQVRSRFHFYDTLLLHIITHHPKSFQKIMETLFKKNDFAKVLKFLDEDTAWYEEAKIFMSIPWSPFFNAIYERFFKQIPVPKSVENRRSVRLDSVAHG